jgi:predicted aspartyl protease
MPHHNQYFRDQSGKLNPNVLLNTGPILEAEIDIPPALMDYLKQQKKRAPKPIKGWILIDTGATRTAVDERTIKKLKVSSIGTTQVTTARGKKTCGLYPCKLRFTSTAIPDIDLTRATGVNLARQSVANKPIIALLGIDVLSKVVFVYNGPGSHFSFSL